MKKKKFFFLMIIICLFILIGAILYIIIPYDIFLVGESDEAAITNLNIDATVTKEERILLEQEYTRNSIDEILSEYEFETEEDESRIRGEIYEHFLEGE